MKGFAFLLFLATCAAAARAQPCTSASQPTTTSLYDPACITLLPGFETTTSGFEARTRLPEATAGRWSVLRPWTPFVRNAGGPTGMIGIHTHVLPNGQVLSWEGHNDNLTNNHTSHAYTWYADPNAVYGGVSYPNIYLHYDNEASNIFCSGHTFLADGRLLVAGGHYSDGVVDRGDGPQHNQPAPVPPPPVSDMSSSEYIPPGYGDVNGYIGLRDVNVYNYRGASTTKSDPDFVWQTPDNYPFGPYRMQYRRWYPTATTLADGRVLVVAGQQYGGNPNHPAAYQAEIPEVFTPSGTGGSWQTVPGGQRQLPNYPWMFLLPNGLVYNPGPNYNTGYFNPTAAAITAPGPTAGSSVTVQPNTWGDGPRPLWTSSTGAVPGAGDYFNGYRGYGTAVMYQPGKLLVLGGAGEPGVTNTTELLDFGQAAPQWYRGAPMRYPRYHPNATLLADGSVLVTGGTQTTAATDAAAVLPTELWTPDPQALNGGSWRELAALDAPRLYHSTAVLLPDATVLTTGGGQGGGYPDHPDYQVFTPPYLCQPGGYRPTISYAPPAVAYGQAFKVQTPDAGTITRATWVRLSSVTHSFNMNQRFLELAVSYPGGTNPNAPAGELLVTAPTSATECPPGHYMLFLLDGQGVPSVARIMQVSASACQASLDLTASQQQTGPCAGTIRFTVSASTGNQADYQWEVNGQPVSAATNQTFLDVNTSNTSPTVRVQVTATRSCAGPAPTASQQVTMYFRGCSGLPYERPAAGR